MGIPGFQRRTAGALLILFFSGILVQSPEIIQAQTVTAIHTYVTWWGTEVDKLASLWLIKRFVDPRAQFIFLPKGTLPAKDAGTPIDLPITSLRRDARRSCFEAVEAHFKIRAACLDQLRRSVHDLELNYWQTPKDARTTELNRNMRAVTGDETRDQRLILQEAFSVLDSFVGLRFVKGVVECRGVGQKQ